MSFTLLTCPVCQAPLSPPADNFKRLVCSNNHSFDQAKQGYWNLLLAQNKRSKAPGDSKEMLVARREFLAKGHYQAIAQGVNKAIQSATDHRTSVSLADIGCGEGYYTVQMHALLAERGLPHQMIAVDIAKDAARLASQKHKQPEIFWAVASGARMPVQPHSLDVATVLFSRLMPEPLHHCLKADGELIAVWPGAQHLIELRQKIYNTVRDDALDASELLSSHFDEVELSQVNTTVCLTDEDSVRQLLLMTPHGQRIQDKAAELLSEGELTLTLNVNIGRYRPKQLV